MALTGIDVKSRQLTFWRNFEELERIRHDEQWLEIAHALPAKVEVVGSNPIARSNFLLQTSMRRRAGPSAAPLRRGTHTPVTCRR